MSDAIEAVEAARRLLNDGYYHHAIVNGPRVIGPDDSPDPIWVALEVGEIALELLRVLQGPPYEAHDREDGGWDDIHLHGQVQQRFEKAIGERAEKRKGQANE